MASRRAARSGANAAASPDTGRLQMARNKTLFIYDTSNKPSLPHRAQACTVYSNAS